MEGKNCFRTAWSQQPIYSGGNFSTLLLPIPPSTVAVADSKGPFGKEKEKELCLAMACGNAINIVSASGEVRTTFTLPTDDVILSVDSVTVSSDISAKYTADSTIRSDTARTEDAGSIRHSKSRKTENTTNILEVENGLPEEDEDTVPPGAYVAIGTRTLQIYVIRVDCVVMEPLNQSLEEDSKPQESTIHDVQKNEHDKMEDEEVNVTVEYTCEVVKQWTAAQQAISCLSFSSRGHLLISGATDGGIKVWNVFHHHLTHNLHCPSSTLINAIYVCDNNQYLVSGTFEGYISVFDLEKKQVVASGRPHVQAVEAISVRLPEGVIFSVARDRKVSVMRWNAKTKSLEEQRAIVVKEHLSAATFEGHFLLHTGSLDGVVTTYAISEDGGLSKKSQLPKPAGSNADDRTEEAAVRCIRLQSVIKGMAGTWKHDADPAASALLVADTGFNINQLVPVSSSEYGVKHTLVGYLDQVLELKFLPPSLPFDRLVINNSKDVRLYDGNGCLSSRCLQGHVDVVMCAAVSADGRIIATAGKDMEVRFWSTSTWEVVGIGENGHTAEITALRFNNKQADDYLVLFSISADENLRLWDVGKHVLPQLGTSASSPSSSSSSSGRFPPRAGVNSAHVGPVYTIEVAPNDQYVASGGKDKVVNLWSVTGKKIFKEGVLRGHRRGITSLAFSSVDRVLASASNDGSVRLWSLTALTCIKTLQADKAAVLQVKLFNASTQAVTTNAEGVIRVWAIGAGEVVWTGEVHEEKVWALTVQEKGDETIFLTGAADGVIIATEDCTTEEVARIREERSDVILKEQDLANRIRKGDFKGAFELALRLDHPRHLRQVVERWIASDAVGCDNTLRQEVIPDMKEPLLIRLLQFIREWLTNSRHCTVASVLLRAFMGCKHFDDVAKIPAMRQLVEPLLAYSRKHSQRLHGLLHKTYYVDYVTRNASAQMLTSEPPYVNNIST